MVKRLSLALLSIGLIICSLVQPAFAAKSKDIKVSYVNDWDRPLMVSSRTDTKIKVDFRYTTMYIDWDWDYFAHDATTLGYHRGLAVAGLVLSAAAEQTQGKDKVEEILTDGLGFDNGEPVSLNYDEKNNHLDNPAITFASKKIELSGREKIIIAVVVRGTSDLSDVITDLEAQGTGFYPSILSSYEQLVRYILNLDTIGLLSSRTDDVILFITGHSLGGACAGGLSMLASKDFNQNQIFTYTFASPKYLKLEATVNGTIMHKRREYPNVINIVNCDDIVPTIPVNFVYDRIGIDYKFDIDKLRINQVKRYFKVCNYLYFGEKKEHDVRTYMAILLRDLSDEELDEYFTPVAYQEDNAEPKFAENDWYNYSTTIPEFHVEESTAEQSEIEEDTDDLAALYLLNSIVTRHYDINQMRVAYIDGDTYSYVQDGVLYDEFVCDIGISTSSYGEREYTITIRQSSEDVYFHVYDPNQDIENYWIYDWNSNLLVSSEGNYGIAEYIYSMITDSNTTTGSYNTANQAWDYLGTWKAGYDYGGQAEYTLNLYNYDDGIFSFDLEMYRIDVYEDLFAVLYEDTEAAFASDTGEDNYYGNITGYFVFYDNAVELIITDCERNSDGLESSILFHR